MALSVSKDETDTFNKGLITELGNAVNYNFEFTFLNTLKPSNDLTTPFYVKAPFDLVIKLV